MARECTLFVGNLSSDVDEDLLLELFVQAGPVNKVSIPRHKTGEARGFAFVEFSHEESVLYSMALLYGVKLFGRNLNLQTRDNKPVHNKYHDKLQDYWNYTKHHRSSSYPVYSNSGNNHGLLQHQHSAHFYNTNVPNNSWHDTQQMDANRRMHSNTSGSRQVNNHYGQFSSHYGDRRHR